VNHLVHHLVLAAAERHGERLALIDGARRLTYAELALAARRFAGALRARGIRRGDRVVVLLPNGADLVIALLGCLAAGAVLVPAHPQTKSRKLAYVLRETEAAALCAPAPLGAIWREALEIAGAAGVQVFVTGDGGWDGPAFSDDGAIDLDLAAIIYTSGTTGEPKGVMLSHRNMRAAAGAVSSYLRLREDDVVACVLPMCFSYGLYQPLLAALAGATVLVEQGFTFPVKVLEAMQRERATVFPAVPAIYAALLELPTLDRFDLSTLRLFTNAAAALPLVHVQALRARFPGVALCSMYGQTECKRISYLDPSEIEQRPASVGRGMPNQQLYLLRADGQLVDTHAGAAEGQLVVRGSHVMRGYWRKPTETAAKLRADLVPGESLLLTGDLFRSDAEGYLYFVGRTDDIIKSRGEKVSPLEVENALHELPGVARAAVIGVPDPLLGEAVKAYIVTAPEVTLGERDVIKHCLARLENYMVPKHVQFVAALPMTGSGKVDKSALKKEIS
jgi:acyl-CoA synthetase (AMP-forming)/AMP-acid ligase II